MERSRRSGRESPSVQLGTETSRVDVTAPNVAPLKEVEGGKETGGNAKASPAGGGAFANYGTAVVSNREYGL